MLNRLDLGIVTFWRLFCRCCVDGGDGDLRSDEDILWGEGVGSRIGQNQQTLNAWCHFETLSIDRANMSTLNVDQCR